MTLEILKFLIFYISTVSIFHIPRMAQKRHKRVRTWTRNINIFNKDYIFVPVNES